MSSTPKPAHAIGARISDESWNELVPDRWYARRGHRWFDRALLVLLLPPAIPLMFAIGLVNALSFRSLRKVFFLQGRIGYRGRRFEMFKFRTMKEVSTCAMGSWSSGEEHLRVTRFGRLLRQTHLDELPQIFNILMGEMSFIGPRPEMVEIEAWARGEIPRFSERLAIRPGVAGFAQITQGYTGRSVEAYKQKLEINLSYMERMSFGFDLEIVARTIIWMVRGKGWQWNRSSAALESVDRRNPIKGSESEAGTLARDQSAA